MNSGNLLDPYLNRGAQVQVCFLQGHCQQLHRARFLGSIMSMNLSPYLTHTLLRVSHIQGALFTTQKYLQQHKKYTAIAFFICKYIFKYFSSFNYTYCNEFSISDPQAFQTSLATRCCLFPSHAFWYLIIFWVVLDKLLFLCMNLLLHL